MGKLIKYEWRKQRTSRMVILISLAACLVLFLGGLIFQNDPALAVAILLMVFGSIFVLFYTGIESILVLNRDLKTKQSYMLWMVPRSVWEILGAKYICAFLQMLFVFGIFVAAACLCTVAAVLSGGGIREHGAVDGECESGLGHDPDRSDLVCSEHAHWLDRGDPCGIPCGHYIQNGTDPFKICGSALHGPLLCDHLPDRKRHVHAGDTSLGKCLRGCARAGDLADRILSADERDPVSGIRVAVGEKTQCIGAAGRLPLVSISERRLTYPPEAAL